MANTGPKRDIESIVEFTDRSDFPLYAVQNPQAGNPAFEGYGDPAAAESSSMFFPLSEPYGPVSKSSRYRDESGSLFTPHEFTFEQWVEWFESQGIGSLPYNAITIHHTFRPSQWQWVGLQHIHNLRAYYRDVNRWPDGRMPHLFITDGRGSYAKGSPRIFTATHPAHDGIAAINGNHRTIAIECIHDAEVGPFTDEMVLLVGRICKVLAKRRGGDVFQTRSWSSAPSRWNGAQIHRLIPGNSTSCYGKKNMAIGTFFNRIEKVDLPGSGPDPEPGRPQKPQNPKLSARAYNFTATGEADSRVAKDAVYALVEAGLNSSKVQAVTDPQDVRAVSEECLGGGIVGDEVNVVVGGPTLKHTFKTARNFFTKTGIEYGPSRTDTWDAVGHSAANGGHPDGGFVDTEFKVMSCLVDICRREGVDPFLAAILYARQRGWLADEGFDPVDVPEAPEKKPEAPENTPKLGNPRLLVGEPYLTVEQARAWAKSRGAASVFLDLAEHYWKYAPMVGLRPETLYAQSALETNFGKFTGKVPASFNNPAGIKIKSPSNFDVRDDHERFPSWSEGVRAHVNHLCAYAGLDPIGKPHDRYYVVKSLPWAGTCRTIDDLSGRYAPRKDYADFLWSSFLEDLFDNGKIGASGLVEILVDGFDPGGYLDHLDASRDDEGPNGVIKSGAKRAAWQGPLLALVSYALISYGAPPETPDLLAEIVAGGVGIYAAAQRIVEAVYDADMKSV